MKRFISLLLCAIMILSVAACTKKPATTDETTDLKTEAPADKTEGEETKKSPESETDKPVSDTDTEKVTETETDVVADTVGEPDGDTTPTELTQDEALAIAKDFVGDRDPDLGYMYSVNFDSVDAGTYCFKVSMYIEDQGRYSTCGYVLVDPHGNAAKFDW